MGNPIKSIYNCAPKRVRKMAVLLTSYLPIEAIYGKEYIKWKNWLKDSEGYREDQIMEFQMRKLKETLITAYDCTDYYHKLFDDYGFNAREFRQFDQLKTIPYTTKTIIQNNIESMVNNKLDKKRMLYYTTGGSTGIPMGMYKNGSDKVKEAAFVNHIWRTMGYHHFDKMMVLRGAYSGDGGVIKKEGNRLLISTYDMNEDNMDEIYRAIREFRPKFLHVYPSAASMLAEHILLKKLPGIPSIKAIFTASENLYGFQKEQMEKAFGCRVFDFYGHTEHACMARQTDRGYETMWQYGYTEMRDDEGTDNAEIVATTFDNTAMPLIRYRTMDIVKEPLGCSGRYCFDSIEGRAQDFILTSSGRKISIAAINMHDEVFDNVHQFQFSQSEIDECVLKIVRKAGYGEADEKAIKSKIGGKLGGGVVLNLKYVKDIPRTKSGKYKFMDQRIALE